MNEVKHTPGPWEWKQPYEGAGYFHLVAIGDYGLHPNGSKVEPVIHDDGSAGDEYSPSIDVHGADAALIAAAPDLYEFAEKFVAALDLKQPTPTMQELHTLEQMAIAAVVKVKAGTR